MDPAVQTLYAELVQRAWETHLGEVLAAEGTVIARRIKGRRYWYLKPSDGSAHRYLGPDSPGVQEAVAHRRETAAAARGMRILVKSILGGGAPRLAASAGRALAALARAGTFRLRGVMVGTTAYQVYGPMLGVRLPAAAAVTRDLDIAQFQSISVAVEDRTDLPLLQALRSIEPEFREQPQRGRGLSTAYVNGSGDFRVEILCPNRGPDRSAPMDLPALGAAGTPLRFLDYLIRGEVKAVALWGNGIPVNVPAPERYAVHKLLFGVERSGRAPQKAAKDIRQAAALLAALQAERPDDLADAFGDCMERGAGWRSRLARGLARVPAELVERLRRDVEPLRALKPGTNARRAKR